MTSPVVRRIVTNTDRLNFKLYTATFALHPALYSERIAIWLSSAYFTRAGIAPAGKYTRKAHIYVVQGARTYSPQPADLRLLPIPAS